MDDSPRSSKRRKLDAPSRNRIVSSPLAKTSTKRAASRLTNRSASYTNGVIEETEKEEENTSRSNGRTARGALNGTPRKRKVAEEQDLYDDIDGALAPSPTPRRKSRSQLSTIRKEDTSSTGDMTDELYASAVTPTKRKTKASSIRESASKNSLQSLANGHKHDAEEADIQDELGVEVSTPSRRRKNVAIANGSTRKTVETQVASTPKSGRRGRPRKATEALDIEEPAATTPSRLSTRRDGSSKHSIILNSEDEIRARKTPVGGSKPLNARRRSNRADHFNNREEQGVVSDAEQATAGAEINDDAMDVDGNSIMSSVLDPTEPSPFNKPASARKDKVTAAAAAAPLPPILLNGNLTSGRELDLLKTIVMERITGKRSPPLVGLDTEYATVHQLIEHTITAGEGNSMLLIGARGSGKTTLVNYVLSDISKENSQDYHVVRLNGFVHTDDKIALREIWRQLGKEMDLEEESGGVGKNYADTLTTLLALLSHPSEQTGEMTDQVARAVVFIMDEFDLFAQHPRQTLLYNLFDIAQSRKAPIAVLGLTTRIDVANSLEKRVKSRFSHRYVHLSLAKSFTSFQEICKACLKIEQDQLSIEERAILEVAPKTTPSKKVKKGAKPDIVKGVLSEWNSNIETLFASEIFLTQHLAPHFYRTKSVPAVLQTFLLPTATLSPSASFYPSNTLAPPDSKLSLLPTLSTLGLSLLISAARLDIIHDSDTCNFNMAYDEYVTLASKARIQSAAGGASSSGSISKVWGKDVARREWEGLVELGLVMPVVSGQTGGFGMIKCDVALEEIGAVLQGAKGVDRGLERWCRQI